ncbi:MAG: Rnase Y domain-containing protein, partial [Candidatus Electryoneaceae bacterium]|nr:Rnase Y domain-containing protein [Candidatus Electryoneaceae bacterium]
MDILVWIIGIIIGGMSFYIAGWFTKKRIDQLKKQSVEEQAKRIIEEAKKASEALKKEKLLELRDEHLKRKTQLESDYESKRAELNRLERKVREQERSSIQNTDKLDKKSRELKTQDRELQKRLKKFESENDQLQLDRSNAAKQLEEAAGISREDALHTLRQELIERAKQDSAEMIKDIRDQARFTANREAKELIVQAIQRSAAEHSAETTVTVVSIPNDDVKGRIIGREGRNIRSFETCTGVELIIDDTPGAVTISCFDPLR